MKKRSLGCLTVADDELPCGKFFIHVDRKLLRIYLLWLLIITEYNENNNDLEMDDIVDIGMEVEVNEDLTYELEDHFDHQSEGAIISKTTEIEF